MRNTWDQTWMTVAETVAQRSACVRRQAGCVIVDENNRVLSTGYNGPPPNYEHDYPECDHCDGSGFEPQLDGDAIRAPQDCDVCQGMGFIVTDTCRDYCPRSKGVVNPMSYDDCVALHAEANALLYTDPYKAVGGSAYITSGPCFSCAKLLSGAKLDVVTYSLLEVDRDRAPEKTIEYLQDSGIDVRIWQALEEFQPILEQYYLERRCAMTNLPTDAG